MDAESTTRTAAKWLLRAAVDLKMTQLTADTVDNYTRYEKNSIAVKLGSGLVGTVVSAKLSPITDKIVDTTADFTAAKWSAFRAKRNDKKKDQ